VGPPVAVLVVALIDYLTNGTSTLSPGTTYTITVGAGGTNPAGTASQGATCCYSSATAVGGGYGGSYSFTSGNVEATEDLVAVLLLVHASLTFRHCRNGCCWARK
jgi:hypothetical protein